MNRMSRWARTLLVLTVFGHPSDAAAERRDAGASTTVEASEIDMVVGENRTISATDVKNFSEGSPGVLDVKLTTDGSQFVLAGVKPGSTTLLLIRRDGTHINYAINVFARSPSSVQKELEQLMESNLGLRLRRVGARFFIEGGVASEAEQRRLSHIASLYPGQVESLVEVGAVSEDQLLNIRIDFYFVQFNKDSGYTVGMSWPSRIGGDGVLTTQATYDFIAHTTSSATATITHQPLPALDIASRKGWAKVLKQATIITGNGVEATFRSGGEQNFQIVSNLTGSIRSIEFGINLSVLPRYDRSKREMQVKISAENNDLVPPVGATPLPGRDTSGLSTLVHLKLGQSIVLSGISSKAQRHSVSGLPLLSDIPVLGLLFGSHQDADSRVEGAVFIIPSVVETLPRASLDTIESAMSQYEKFKGGEMRSPSVANPIPPVLRDRP